MMDKNFERALPYEKETFDKKFGQKIKSWKTVKGVDYIL